LLIIGTLAGIRAELLSGYRSTKNYVVDHRMAQVEWHGADRDSSGFAASGSKRDRPEGNVRITSPRGDQLRQA
jgi:hypothetical protein